MKHSGAIREFIFYATRLVFIIKNRIVYVIFVIIHLLQERIISDLVIWPKFYYHLDILIITLFIMCQCKIYNHEVFYFYCGTSYRQNH